METRTVYRAYKYRLYPTVAQQCILAQHFGAVRWVYNWGLATRRRAWEESKERVPYNTLQAQLPNLKKEYSWLKDPYSQSLQMSLQNLDKAYCNFLEGRARCPDFKKRHYRQSLAFCQPQASPLITEFVSNTLRIPKIGPVKCVYTRLFTGKLKSVAITKTPSGKYFASCLVECEEPAMPKPALCENQAIGIDLGIKTFATLSNGETIANPRNLTKALKRLRRASRQHSKKQKGSKNREKSRLKLARLHQQVANRRSDFLHKTTTSLVKRFDTLCVEDLNVKGMGKNHRLARHIKDAAFGEFRRQLTYKADWQHKNLLVIDRFAPSSKQCTCGVKNQDLTLKQRTWTCGSCGATHDRDLLAAQNIVRFAFHTDTD